MVAVQDVHASPEVVWGRIMDFGAYPRMVPLVADCSEYGRRPRRGPRYPRPARLRPPWRRWAGAGARVGVGAGAGEERTGPGERGGAVPLRRAAAVEDLGAQALRVGSELPANLRRAREAISQFPARAHRALRTGRVARGGARSGRPGRRAQRGADKPGVSEEILVELVMKLGVVRCT